MGVGGQRHPLAALPTGKTSGTHCLRPRAGLDEYRKCHPHQCKFSFRSKVSTTCLYRAFFLTHTHCTDVLHMILTTHCLYSNAAGVSTTQFAIRIRLAHITHKPYHTLIFIFVFCTAIDYGLDGPVIESLWGEIFRPSRPALKPTQPPVQWVPGVYRG